VPAEGLQLHGTCAEALLGPSVAAAAVRSYQCAAESTTDES
jgi:hypothetical protein